MRIIIIFTLLILLTNYSTVNSSEESVTNTNVRESKQIQIGNNDPKIRIGLYGIGLDVYWSQFEGLEERLHNYQNLIAQHILDADMSIDVINTGIVDNPSKAREVGKLLAKKNVDAIFLYISTYALSSTVLPVVQQLKVPVIVLSLQPSKAIDYKSFNALNDRGKMTGEWLAYCQACSVPEIASVFNRAQIDYHLIAGSLDDETSWEEIDDWLKAIKITSTLRNMRIGLLGHYYGGMLDVYTDLAQISSVFGSHIEFIEMSTLYKHHREITDDQVNRKMEQFHTEFIVDERCSEQELKRAAKSSVALESLVSKEEIDCMAYYYEGSDDKRYEDIITSLIPGNTLLTKHNIPVAGEYEVKNVIAMKIMDIMGSGGSFSEFYAMDLNDDVILLGHDGPGHAMIAEGSVNLVPLPVFHGKPGSGLSIQMAVKQGPVTLLSVVQEHDGTTKLLVAEGESVSGPTLNIGNTNSRYSFPIGAKRFIKEWSEQGPAHHMAVGIGHVAKTLEKLAKLLGIKFIKIC